MKSLLAKAQRLSAQDDAELTGEVPILSATGDDVAIAYDASSDAFSSVIETDADRPRPSLSGGVNQQSRKGTNSQFEKSEDIWAEDVGHDALVAALKKTHGNVSATARALGRPRALVLRWLRDLNVDPMLYR